jgi:hypothetical protein
MGCIRKRNSVAKGHEESSFTVNNGITQSRDVVPNGRSSHRIRLKDREAPPFANRGKKKDVSPTQQVHLSRLGYPPKEDDPRRGIAFEFESQVTISNHPESGPWEAFPYGAKGIKSMSRKLCPLKAGHIDECGFPLLLREDVQGRNGEPLRDNRDESESEAEEIRFRGFRNRECRNVLIRAEPTVLKQIPAKDAQGKMGFVEPEFSRELMD